MNLKFSDSESKLTISYISEDCVVVVRIIQFLYIHRIEFSDRVSNFKIWLVTLTKNDIDIWFAIK